MLQKNISFIIVLLMLIMFLGINSKILCEEKPSTKVSTESTKERGRFIYEYPGYTDTPFIPGTKFRVHQRNRPQPPRVKVAINNTESSAIPLDAEILFDGTNLNKFQKNSWNIDGGILIAGQGNLVTKKAYGDCQLHVEWRCPNPPGGKPANMGNSGVFLMGLYELQIYDSFSSKIYADGSAAAIYGQTPPLVNACLPPGQWQSYDIIFKAPVFNGGKLIQPGTLTVFHNNVLVHYNIKILGPTAHRTIQPYRHHAARLPLIIQGHGSPVAFRNIWIRELALTNKE